MWPMVDGASVVPASMTSGAKLGSHAKHLAADVHSNKSLSAEVLGRHYGS